MRLLILLFTSSLLSWAVSASESSCPSKPIAPIQDQLPDFTKVDLAPKHNAKREAEITNWWAASCPNFSQQKVKRYRQDNLICRLSGNSERTLVVGAHYDKVSAGYGVADNWSGVLLLDALMQHFTQSQNHGKRTLSLEFVAFAAEEDGLFGSKAYIQQLEHPVIGMINLDTIGLTDLIIDGGSDANLSCRAREIARQLDIVVNQQRWRALSSDWERFEKAGIPAIGIHSVNKRTVRRIHHKRDKAGNVDLKRMSEAYVLIRHLVDDLTL